MYKAFFGLQRNPFDISPDPYFLYPTSRYYEALAALFYGIRARKGFVVLTGEVGTGKTMVVRCLLEKLDKGGLDYAYVFNPLMSAREFLRYVCSDLGLTADWSNKADMLLRFHELLIRRHAEGRTTVLVVDEAHLLSKEVLEEIRLLTNLETARDKLLQIALVGQPELDAMLESQDLRQLKQRIALRYHLQPLTPEELKGYVEWRLKRAGANGRPIFAEEALGVLYRHSRGYPRLVNTICENALITAYAAGARPVSRSMVEEACSDLRLSGTAAGTSHEQALEEARIFAAEHGLMAEVRSNDGESEA